jgi:hypothetical protein
MVYLKITGGGDECSLVFTDRYGGANPLPGAEGTGCGSCTSALNCVSTWTVWVGGNYGEGEGLMFPRLGTSAKTVCRVSSRRRANAYLYFRLKNNSVKVTVLIGKVAKRLTGLYSHVTAANIDRQIVLQSRREPIKGLAGGKQYKGREVPHK